MLYQEIGKKFCFFLKVKYIFYELYDLLIKKNNNMKNLLSKIIMVSNLKDANKNISFFV